MESGGLAAAMTLWPEQDPPLDVARLLAYEETIANIHATRTVIPLRFGCVVDGESEVLRLLQQHRLEYERLLTQWEGLTEMGLRVWRGARSAAGPPAGAGDLSVGARYLAAVRERCPGLMPDERKCALRIADRLKGLYRGSREEAGSASNGRLVSLYFLVPRASVGDFREKARSIDLLQDMKLMVSGPWPPYNFASPAAE